MDEIVRSLIYPGSPFLPTLTKEIVQEMDGNIGHTQSLTSAIAIELIFLGRKQQETHSKISGYLKRIYQLNIDDLNEYVFGFNVAPFLIILSLAKGDPQDCLNTLSDTVFYASPRTTA